MDDLKAMFPLKSIVTVSGMEGSEEVHVRPFRFGQIPRVTELMESLYDDFKSEDVELMELLKKGVDDVMELMALSAGKDSNWVRELAADEGMTLLSAVIEVNSDFFAHRLGPALQALKGALSGLKSSSSSSPTATGGGTSSNSPRPRSESSTASPKPETEPIESNESPIPAAPTPSPAS